MGAAVDSICQPLMGLTMQFSTTVDSHKLHTKYQVFNTLPAQNIGYAVLQGEASIAHEVFQNLL